MERGYRESRPAPALEPLVACLWVNDPPRPRAQRIVPDACVDVVWLAGRELVVAGADTGPRVVDLPGGAPSAGVRLRAAGAGAVLGVGADAVVDCQVPLAELWGDEGARLEERVAAAAPERRAGILARAVARRTADGPDPLVEAAVRELAAGATVAEAAALLAVSERQLHRRVRAAVGYGPKTLARVLRLRRLVALEPAPLAARALDAGYASQAHMTDEVRRLTGTTPVRFLEDARLTAA